MDTVADKLREARALVAKGWTQGVYARTVGGRCIGYEENNAACWCPLGALFRVAHTDDVLRPAYIALERATGIANVPRWNDDPKRTQAEVLAAFDKAIELAEAGQ